MAFLRGIIALPLIIVVVLFAVAHTEKVSVTLIPFASANEMPLYVVALGFLAVGFLLGAMISWISMGKVRKERRQLRKANKKLEKELEKSENSHEQALNLAAVKDLTPIEDKKNGTN